MWIEWWVFSIGSIYFKPKIQLEETCGMHIGVEPQALCQDGQGNIVGVGYRW
jgi:cation transport regulator ChaC